MRSLQNLSTALTALCLVFLFSTASFARSKDIALPRADGAETPVRLYGDWSRGACGPTLILSHGLGGTRRGLSFYAQAAEEHGYRTLVMGHLESGPAQLRRILGVEDKGAYLRNPKIWRSRALDLDAAVAFVKSRGCWPSPFVLGGHSLGAATTMLEAGARGRMPFRAKNRFDGYIALSPQGIGWAFANDKAWRRVDRPVLMMTGTQDRSVDGTYKARLSAWDALPSGHKRLGLFRRASHRTLGGRGKPFVRARIKRLFGEFLDQIRFGWRPSSYTEARGVAIEEK